MVRLRAWQQEALARFEAHPNASFLAVATPGAGKTTFALAAVLRALLAGACPAVRRGGAHPAPQDAVGPRGRAFRHPPGSRLVGRLRRAALRRARRGGHLPAGGGQPGGAAARWCGRALVVLDEIHHAGESRSWGDGVRTAFEPAVRRLCLSGTPFRSDQSTIPFVRYEGDLASADYEYGYGEALERPRGRAPGLLPAHRRPHGVDRARRHRATRPPSTIRLTRELANQRLRTALNAEGDWLPAVLEQAHAQLQHLRARDPARRRAGHRHRSGARARHRRTSCTSAWA